jgi:hypothetical protein
MFYNLILEQKENKARGKKVRSAALAGFFANRQHGLLRVVLRLPLAPPPP